MEKVHKCDANYVTKMFAPNDSRNTLVPLGKS